MEIKGIVIDAGHGGDDPGATGNDIIEKEYTLKISKYMYEKFKNLGIPVKMTRETDETLSPSKRVKLVKEAFGDYANVILISNHINAGGGDGAEVVYALRNTSELPDLILKELEKEGQNIRKAYQRRYPSNTSKDYYFMQRNTGNIQSLTVEYGFLDSTKDDVEQLKNNWKNYVDAVVRAVLEYIDFEDNSSTYIVKKGDSLYSIAKKYNTTVENLMNLNNLNSTLLTIGQKLNISNNTYIVKKGDSLYSIAKKYNTTVENLMKKNNLTSTMLSINQKLVI